MCEIKTDSLRDSLLECTTHCFKQLRCIRKAFPITQNQLGLQRLECLLKFLFGIFNTNAYKYCFPFQNTLVHELNTILKASVAEWFEQTVNKHFHNVSQLVELIRLIISFNWVFSLKGEEENIKQLNELTQVVYIDLYLAYKYYSPIFEK